MQMLENTNDIRGLHVILSFVYTKTNNPPLLSYIIVMSLFGSGLNSELMTLHGITKVMEASAGIAKGSKVTCLQFNFW
jgi:hypothetical protein